MCRAREKVGEWEKQRAFVIRPFGTKKNSAGPEINFDEVHKKLIGPALGELGMIGGTTGDIVEPGNIREDMFARRQRLFRDGRERGVQRRDHDAIHVWRRDGFLHRVRGLAAVAEPAASVRVMKA